MQKIFSQFIKFAKDTRGVFLLMTFLLLIPIFTFITFIIDGSGLIYDKAQLNRAVEQAALLLTAENNEGRGSSAPNPALQGISIDKSCSGSGNPAACSRNNDLITGIIKTYYSQGSTPDGVVKTAYKCNSTLSPEDPSRVVAIDCEVEVAYQRRSWLFWGNSFSTNNKGPLYGFNEKQTVGSDIIKIHKNTDIGDKQVNLPKDIILVLDASGSMSYDGTSPTDPTKRIKTLQKVLRDLAPSLLPNGTYNRLGVILYGGETMYRNARFNNKSANTPVASQTGESQLADFTPSNTLNWYMQCIYRRNQSSDFLIQGNDTNSIFDPQALNDFISGINQFKKVDSIAEANNILRNAYGKNCNYNLSNQPEKIDLKYIVGRYINTGPGDTDSEEKYRFNGVGDYYYPTSWAWVYPNDKIPANCVSDPLSPEYNCQALGRKADYTEDLIGKPITNKPISFMQTMNLISAESWTASITSLPVALSMLFDTNKEAENKKMNTQRIIVFMTDGYDNPAAYEALKQVFNHGFCEKVRKVINKELENKDWIGYNEKTANFSVAFIKFGVNDDPSLDEEQKQTWLKCVDKDMYFKAQNADELLNVFLSATKPTTGKIDITGQVVN